LNNFAGKANFYARITRSFERMRFGILNEGQFAMKRQRETTAARPSRTAVDVTYFSLVFPPPLPGEASGRPLPPTVPFFKVEFGALVATPLFPDVAPTAPLPAPVDVVLPAPFDFVVHEGCGVLAPPPFNVV
jgi:hypothetical protein